MSRRNFTLLIIITGIIVMLIVGFLYSRNTPTSPTGGDSGTNFLARFNPFGNNTDTTTDNENEPVDITGETPTETPTQSAEIKLRKISSVPVAGFNIFLKERLKEIPVITPEVTTTETTTPAPKKTTKPTPPPTEFAQATRYVDRKTGNIYQLFLDKLEERRFSTTIIPKVYESIFVNKNNSILMRYLKPDARTIETFLGGIPKEVLGADTDTNEIKGIFLSDNITDLSLSPDSSKIFYLLNAGESVVGTVLDIATNKKTQVFDSPFTEWLSFWPNASMVTLTTKPTAFVQGHMYTLNPTTKSFSRVLGDIAGLTTLTSPNGKLVLYGDSSLSLSTYDVAKKTSTSLGLRTMPEKCVWGSVSDVVYCAVPKLPTGAEYPDSWYQGEVSFSDQIWKINIITGNTELISDPFIASGEEVDGIKLSLDTSQKYLLFVNKKDSFLWKLDLN